MLAASDMIFGGFEMLVVASVASILTGLAIVQRTPRERPAMQLFGRVLLYVGGGLIALFVIMFVASR
jgi:hypothetical protein